MLRAAKDAVAARSAKLYLNDRLERYGKVEDLTIDSRNRSLRMTCRLHGDPGAIVVEVGRYVLEGDGAERSLRCMQCRCSKAWVENLLVDLVETKTFPIPPWVAAALS